MNTSDLVLDPKKVELIRENTAILAKLVIQHRIFQHPLNYGLSRMDMGGKIIEKERPNTRKQPTSRIYIHYALGQPEVASCDVVFKMEKDSESGTHVVVATLTPMEKGNGKGVNLFFIYLMLLLAYHSGVQYVKLPLGYKKEDLIQGLEVKSSWFGGLPIPTGKEEILLNLKGTDEDEWEFRSLKIIRSMGQNAKGIWLQADPSMGLISLAHRKAPPPAPAPPAPVAPAAPAAPAPPAPATPAPAPAAPATPAPAPPAAPAPATPVAQPIAPPIVPDAPLVNESKGFFNRLKRSVNNVKGSNTAKRMMNSAKGSMNRLKGSVNELKVSNTAKRMTNSAKGSMNRLKGWMNSSSPPPASVPDATPATSAPASVPVAPTPSKGIFNSLPSFSNPFRGGKTNKKRRGSTSLRHRRRASKAHRYRG